MNRICTSIEQSKKLIDLGIDVNTADMCYIDGSDKDCQVKDGTLDYEDIPAWSLSVLLELMPKELEDDLDLCYGTFYGNGEYPALWACSCINYIDFGDTPVDAAFKVVCWLLKNKEI